MRSPIDFIASLSPWLSPAPTAYIVARATIRHLSWPVSVAVTAAVVAETLGLATIATALTLYQYNRSRRKTDPAAPLGLALAAVGIYFVAAILLTVMLDILPAAATYAPGMFPALSLVGMGVLVLRYDHRERLAAIAQARDEQRQARAERRKAVQEQKRAAPTFLCVHCGRAFERQKQLSGHMKAHVNGNGTNHKQEKEIDYELRSL